MLLWDAGAGISKAAAFVHELPSLPSWKYMKGRRGADDMVGEALLCATYIEPDLVLILIPNRNAYGSIVSPPARQGGGA